MKTLGSMTGIITPENVVQFRAIPYATIPARFKNSIPTDTILDKHGDFTKPGSACPQVFASGTHSGGPMPNEPHPPQSSEYSCLILQLNIPLAHLQSLTSSSPKLLPILTYIHGGGFVRGKIDEEHNTSLIVEQSISNNQPIISASIQYRLGALGYLHTGEEGSANLALNDQRNALLWIQRFARGFGGDVVRVTVFGESAGGMSICAHMLCRQPRPRGPLFQRAILMSGCLGPMTLPVLPEEAEQRYRMVLEKCGIAERGEEGLARLREVDVQRIVDVAAEISEDGGMWLSVQESGWFGEDAGKVTWDVVPSMIGKCEWVEEIMLGSTGFEGSMFIDRLTDLTPTAFLSSLTAQLGPEAASLTRHAYNMTPEMDQNLFLTSALHWIGDVIFEAPTHLLAQHLSAQTDKKIYRYVFAVRNPFPGSPFYALSHHWVDLYFVFKTLQFRYPTQELKDISTRQAQLWIEFANGMEPWGEYRHTGQGDEVVMVAEEKEGWRERSVGEWEGEMKTGWGRHEGLVASWEGMRGRVWKPLAMEALKGRKLT